MFYQMVRDATRAAQQTQPVTGTVAVREPERAPLVTVKNTVGIQPKNLNTEVAAADWNLTLKYVCDILTTYARFEQPEDVITIALWIASTYMVEPTPEQGMKNGKMLYEAHPLLFLISEAGSGKNRVMKIVKNLVRNPTPIGTGTVTSYGVRNAVEAGMTVLIDDYHMRVGATGKKQSDLQEIVLAYSQEAGSIDGQGGTYNTHDLFGPKMLAAQPSITKGIQGNEMGHLFERSFIIHMPKWTDPTDPIPDLDDEYEQMCDDLRAALTLWGASSYELLMRDNPKSKRYRPIHSMPTMLTARMREISLPLFAVADRAVNPDLFGEGTPNEDLEWAKLARNAVQVLLLGHGDNAREILDKLRARFRNPE